MSLDLRKIEKPVEVADGFIRARCPACAETGQDSKGEHLRIYPDGKFGCCVFPGDREHRKRIFALVGESQKRGISVKIAVNGGCTNIQKNVLGKISLKEEAPSHGNAECKVQNEESPEDTSNQELQVQREFDLLRTARTAPQECKVQNAQYKMVDWDNSRTVRTSFSYLRACREEKDKIDLKVKEFEEGVRSVRENGRLPYITAGGDLIIPFDSPERYHWWNGGQSPRETIEEVRGLRVEG